jgi:hypothetical protein
MDGRHRWGRQTGKSCAGGMWGSQVVLHVCEAQGGVGRGASGRVVGLEQEGGAGETCCRSSPLGWATGVVWLVSTLACADLQ